ncbi:PAS domain S-box protein [Leptolyngbya sp. NK1-12]|uniref:Circadian input-output histidine kinase CikA n=1 Tax=Leptolyngbya sp. NK1-12 TaxID=2547451 RepID=A0AA97ASL3_9CYAN|nr:PAS domain S-box protein [Leptolyngbya sp. NK1-12]
MYTEDDENHTVFTQHIQAVQERTQALYQNASELPWRQPQLVLDCLQELWLALEELQVAEEELRQQHDALLEAQHAIEAERQRYQELFEFAPDGYLVTDLHGTVREANQAAASLFHISSNRLVGKPLINFVPDGQRRAFRKMLNQLPTVNRVQEWELVLCGRDGEPFDAALTVETVRIPAGEATALRWLVRDITLRKQAEEQLRQVQLQNLQLLEADRLRSQFMATISHELRTPMNAILGFSELLLRQFHRRHDVQLIPMVEPIFRNGRHLLTLIEEMLDFSKLKAERLELQLESFDLVEFVTQTVEELRPLASQKALNLTVKSTESHLAITNDPTRLRQVMINLLSNAIKFTDVGGITVEVGELPLERVRVTVQDTGIGIAPEDQSQIFREFWQVNQTTTRKQGGTGLGLAIVYALVKLMQGNIAVESELGRGTTFRIDLPRWVVSASAHE